MRITLTVTEGPHEGRVFTFGEHDTFIVGRAKDAQMKLALDDKYFSRHHFMIEVNPPHCRLMDLGSRNGTFVNGIRITTADLNDGDMIKAGRTVLRASIDRSPAESGQAEPTASSAPGYATVYPAATAGSSAEPIVLTEADVVDNGGDGEGVGIALTGASSAPPAKLLACPTCGAPRLAGSRAGKSVLCDSCETSAGATRQPIAGYRIVRELGRGAMGVVHLALRTKDASAVALKTITPNTQATQADIKRFLREARILRDLVHPNIVAFGEMGESHGCFYFTMDFVRGTDAARLLKRQQGGLPIGRAVDIAYQLLAALDYAHAKKFVHRDLKPANLLVTEGYDRAGKAHDVIKVADFGLARVYQSTTFSGLTMQGDYGGTYPFMPPEQITQFKDARPANDLYAVGATLYNLLTSKYVYDFPPAIERSVQMLLQEDPVPIRNRRKDIPPALAKAIHRALARDPLERYESARAMQEALGAFRTAQ